MDFTELLRGLRFLQSRLLETVHNVVLCHGDCEVETLLLRVVVVRILQFSDVVLRHARHLQGTLDGRLMNELRVLVRETERLKLRLLWCLWCGRLLHLRLCLLLRRIEVAEPLLILLEHRLQLVRLIDLLLEPRIGDFLIRLLERRFICCLINDGLRVGDVLLLLCFLVLLRLLFLRLRHDFAGDIFRDACELVGNGFFWLFLGGRFFGWSFLRFRRLRVLCGFFLCESLEIKDKHMGCSFPSFTPSGECAPLTLATRRYQKRAVVVPLLYLIALKSIAMFSRFLSRSLAVS